MRSQMSLMGYGDPRSRGAFAQNTYIGGSAGPCWRWKLANRRRRCHPEGGCPVAPPSAIIEFTSSSSPSWSPNRALLDKGANVVSRTRECAIDPLVEPALLALATPSICCWTSAAAREARHPGAASMQLHGTAPHCRLLCQSLRALKSRATLAPTARRTVAR